VRENSASDWLSILALTGLVGIVFLVTGITMVASFSGVERLAGIACAVMGTTSLVIGVGYVLGVARIGNRPSSGQRLPAIDADEPVVYKRSRGSYVDVIAGIGAAIFISVMVVVGLALVRSGEVAGAGFVLIGGAMWLLIVPASFVGLIRLATDSTVLVLESDGLRIHGVGSIPWQDVQGLSIEDTRPLVAKPGTRVIGSMRQLAIELRPGAQVPVGNVVDRAMRRVAQGFLSIGQAAGRGRYHWLAVRERDIGVPLEEVLHIANAFHAKVGPSADRERVGVDKDLQSRGR
jgi:hypothetical protein